MPKVVPEGFKRDCVAKTMIRKVEDELLKEIAREVGCTPSEILYFATVEYLRKLRPEECNENRIRAALLVVA